MKIEVMNKLLVTVSLCVIGIVSAVGQHEDIIIRANEDEVPVEVVRSFVHDFGKVPNREWRIVTGNVVSKEYNVDQAGQGKREPTFYEVGFAKSEGGASAIYDHYGKLFCSKHCIQKASLPGIVRNKVELEMPGFTMDSRPEAVYAGGSQIAHFRLHLVSGTQSKLVVIGSEGNIIKKK